MHYSLWTYPWDLMDIGINKAFKEMSDVGLNGISLITSYHAGRFLHPRSPKRKVYFPEDGTLYFPYSKEKFENLLIKPVTASLIEENSTFWDQVFESASKNNLKVSGWTVCLHNTRIGMKYPETTVKNAFGDSYFYNLCPSNYDVRTYIKVMIEDLTSKYPFHALELESLNYMGYWHEFHHEKDGVGLTEKDQFLLSLCFCDSCKARAEKDGIDITNAQKIVKQMLNESFERELPYNDDEQFLKKGLEYFVGSPELYKFLKWRSTVVTSLAKEIREAVPQRTKIYFLSLLTPNLSWLFGVNFKEIAEANDGIVVCCYDTAPNQVEKDMLQSKNKVTTSTELYTGLRLFYPEVHNEAELVNKVKNAVNAGSQGFVFYNYSLVPKPRMNWIKSAINSIQ